MKRKVIEVIPGEIGAAIYGTLISIGQNQLDWRFLYKCGHFAPDHLWGVLPLKSSRSGQELCVLCVKAK